MTIPRMGELGLPPVCEKLIQRPRGLFLVTGARGSGKSTSLASMIDYLNENFDRHIITIEDPIESRHTSKKSTVDQYAIGVETPSFIEGLRRASRRDSTVVMVSELRDLPTIEAVINAAKSGIFVFSTLHATGAQAAVNRVIDAFPTTQQDQIRTRLSTSIVGVLAQALLPKIGGGRIAAYEMLVCNSAISNLMRENKTSHITSAIQTGGKQGMVLLDDSLFNLWKQWKCIEADVIGHAQRPEEMAARIASSGHR